MDELGISAVQVLRRRDESRDSALVRQEHPVAAGFNESGDWDGWCESSSDRPQASQSD